MKVGGYCDGINYGNWWKLARPIVSPEKQTGSTSQARVGVGLTLFYQDLFYTLSQCLTTVHPQHTKQPPPRMVGYTFPPYPAPQNVHVDAIGIVPMLVSNGRDDGAILVIQQGRTHHCPLHSYPSHNVDGLGSALECSQLWHGGPLICGSE